MQVFLLLLLMPLASDGRWSSVQWSWPLKSGIRTMQVRQIIIIVIFVVSHNISKRNFGDSLLVLGSELHLLCPPPTTANAASLISSRSHWACLPAAGWSAAFVWICAIIRSQMGAFGGAIDCADVSCPPKCGPAAVVMDQTARGRYCWTLPARGRIVGLALDQSGQDRSFGKWCGHCQLTHSLALYWYESALPLYQWKHIITFAAAGLRHFWLNC